MSEISWKQVAIFSFIPMGQLWARVFLKKGSLDKWWLLLIQQIHPLFMLPPFSTIPLILMKYNWIKDGEGGTPIGFELLLPITLTCSQYFLL